MCGIVGYHGHRKPKDIIMDGLKTLEYRGYDSAGVAIFDHGQVKRIRAEGKLSKLESQLQSLDFDGRTGIGHTRWATHGVPSEKNAHPHTVEGISIVHNGIIENYLEIRDYLLAMGKKIVSDTDSELVAHLIAMEVPKTKDLLRAVLNIIPRLEGAYSIVVIWDQKSDEIVSFKSGPPLILGIGEKEHIIASDIQAIVPYTKNIIYLDDHEIAQIKGQNYAIYNSKGEPINKKIVEMHWTVDRARKQGYPHFMLKEIYEQPRTVAAVVKPFINIEKETLDFSSLQKNSDIPNLEQELQKMERLVIVGCGTSYYAGLTAEYFVERFAGIPVEVELASEFRYRNPILPKNTMVLFISQSGETADTVAALRKVKDMGFYTLSLCNVPHSTIDRETNLRMHMNCEAEVGVASTKAFTASVALLNIFAVYLGKLKTKVNIAAEKSHVRQVMDLPAQMEKALSYADFFKDHADTLKTFKGFLFIGRNVSYPIALEGALKLKEITYLHAEGYAAGEMKHGPIALVDNKMCIIAIAPKDELFEKTISNVEELNARGANIISMGTGQNEKLKRLSQQGYLSMPDAHWSLTPILSVIPLQLMAYHLSNSLGYDVDQPRNLAKSVTVE